MRCRYINVIKITSEYLEIKKADSEGCTGGMTFPVCVYYLHTSQIRRNNVISKSCNISY